MKYTRIGKNWDYAFLLSNGVAVWINKTDHIMVETDTGGLREPTEAETGEIIFRVTSGEDKNEF